VQVEAADRDVGVCRDVLDRHRLISVRSETRMADGDCRFTGAAALFLPRPSREHVGTIER